MDWIYWLIVIIILTIVELSTVNLVTVWFIASGIVVLILSFFIDNFAVLSSIFVILGIILLITTKPILNKLQKGKDAKTNLDRVIGATGVVTEEIKKNVVGEVKVDGKRWSAISNKKILVGETVKILKIDGVKLIVEKESE